MTPIFHLSYHA